MTDTNNTKNELDFNDAGPQKSFDVIPANTVVTLQMTVRPGGVGPGGWLKRSKNGKSEALDCEFVVVDGDYAKRKLWVLYTLHGTEPGHADAADISRKALCAILECAKGVRPDDRSEAANAARTAGSYNDFNNLRFIARLGVEPPSAGYNAKNKILQIITPDKTEWVQPQQIAKPAAAASTAPAAAPANSIARPQWGQS